MYGLNVGQKFPFKEEPFFVGTAFSIEVSLVKSDVDWDFLSLVLKDVSGSIIKIGRNNESFPEPTLFLMKM